MLAFTLACSINKLDRKRSNFSRDARNGTIRICFQALWESCKPESGEVNASDSKVTGIELILDGVRWVYRGDEDRTVYSESDYG